MRYLLTFFLLCAASAFGAAGDYIGAKVAENGWQLLIDFATMGTNGVFRFGFGTNNALTGSQTVKLVTTSRGYDDSGSVTSINRTIYGTMQCFFAYPLHSSSDIVSNETATTVKIALSDYVFATDTNIILTLSYGMYSNLAVSSAAVSSSVTNESKLVSPRVIGEWSWPGFRRSTTNLQLSFVAFHKSAQNGRPVRVVRFEASDCIGNTNIVFVSRMTIDRSKEDRRPTGEYIANMNVSTFTNGMPIHCNATAYPWVGTTESVLDTSTDSGIGTLSPQTNFCDRLAIYGAAVALVSATNYGTGIVVSNFTLANPPIAFQTIDLAASAITLSNSIWFGHKDLGGSTIYLRSGSYIAAGGTAAYNTNPGTWSFVETYPLDSQYSAALTNGYSGSTLANKTKFSNMTIASVGTYLFYGWGNIWLNDCQVSNTSAVSPYHYANTVVATRSWFSDAYWLQSSHATTSFPLVRSCTFSHMSGINMGHTVIGNICTNKQNGGTFLVDNGAGKNFNNIIWYGNEWYFATNSGNGTISFITTNSVGSAIVQNIIELIGGSQPLIQGEAPTITVNNYIIWQNTLLGGRCNLDYNTGSGSHTLWSLVNNDFDDTNIKQDEFNSNAAATNCWSGFYSVGSSGNWHQYVTNTGTIDFSHKFSGLYSFKSTTSLKPDYKQFVKSGSKSSDYGTGWGDYRKKSSSPVLLDVPFTEIILPYDLDGNARGAFDPPGAYSSASPRKGGGFFQ